MQEYTSIVSFSFFIVFREDCNTMLVHLCLFEIFVLSLVILILAKFAYIKTLYIHILCDINYESKTHVLLFEIFQTFPLDKLKKIFAHRLRKTSLKNGI